MMTRWCVAAWLALGASALSGSAFGYCRSTTCDPSLETCDVDANGCIVTGLPLYWPTACVSFGVEAGGSPLSSISAAAAQSVIETAFVDWVSVDCNGSYPSLDVASLGEVACELPEYNTNSGNANVWIFRDDAWPYLPEGEFDGTLALTTVTYNAETGEIYDADVEINAIDNQLTIGDALIVDDLQSIATHETGHFLGLDHTDVDGATMATAYEVGDTSVRSLEADDVAAMCAAYPPGRNAEDAACQPRHGLSLECGSGGTGTGSGGTGTTTGGTGVSNPGNTGGDDESSGGGCSCRLGSQESEGRLGSLALTALGLLYRRRGRTWRRAT